MALESVNHISDLVPTNPASTDPASQGDDHIRNIKKAVKASFPNITGAVTATQAQLNDVANKALKSTTITPAAASGLTGGGDLSANRTFALDLSSLPHVSASGLTPNDTRIILSSNNANEPKSARTGLGDLRSLLNVPQTNITLTAGSGLTGGGDLSANRTFSVDGTVVRTSGPQTLAGPLVVNNTITSTSEVSATTVRANALGLGASGYGFYLSSTVPGIAINVDGTAAGRLEVNDNSTTDGHTLITRLKGDARYAPVGTTITAGPGLTGGGTIGSNQTITLGTPSSIGNSTTNAVTATGHTHEIGPTIARSATTFSAGTGLKGGGSLAANRTFALDLHGLPLVGSTSLTAGETRVLVGSVNSSEPSEARMTPDSLRVLMNAPTTGITFTAGDGLSGGGNLSNSRSFAVDGTVVRTSRTVTAGAGLSGGGTMEADRTIALGTPSSITSTSENVVTSVSHTHYLAPASVRALYSETLGNAIGSYVLAARKSGATQTLNGISAGSTLAPSQDAEDGGTGALTGSWRCMGRSVGPGGTLWIRIS